MKVFQNLGFEDALVDIAFRPEALEARMGRSGLQLFNIPVANAAIERWGAPYLNIYRADYIAVLLKALRAKRPDAVHLGAEIIGYEQTTNAVRAQLADGSHITGDVLIGSDGVHSLIRTAMMGDDTPVFTGNVAWRAVVPTEKLGDLAPRPTACVWVGPGKHCVTYRLRRGALTNFVGVIERDDWTIESWSERGTKTEALADFDGWHPTITRILNEAEELYRWALFDRAPLTKWTDGQVALMGDAAHPMLPFMAQGAAMAVEDAWTLAQQLALTDNAPRALEDYQALRQARASHVQALSRANAKTFHKRTRLSQLATYGPVWLAGKIVPTRIHARHDWLYGHDVTT